MFVSKPFFFFFLFFHVVFISWSFVHVCICSLSLICFSSKFYCTTYIRVPFKHRIYTSISRIQLNFLPWIRCRLIYQLTHFAKKKQRNINFHLHMRKMCLLSSNNCFSITVFYTSTGISKLCTSWHKKKKKKEPTHLYLLTKKNERNRCKRKLRRKN